MRHGCSHTEFIQSTADNSFVFVETSARVGGAYIADMIEAATGLNLWEEWAAIEIAGAGPYQPPPPREEHGGVVISLARTEWPDTSGFTDVEIVEHVKQKNHIGFVLRSPRPERIEELLTSYLERIRRDFHASLPPASTPTH